MSVTHFNDLCDVAEWLEGLDVEERTELWRGLVEQLRDEADDADDSDDLSHAHAALLNFFTEIANR